MIMNSYDMYELDINAAKDYSIRIITSAIVKPIGEIYPEFSHISAFYLLDEVEIKEKYSPIELSIKNVQYPLELINKTVTILYEKDHKYHEKLFMCENEMKKYPIFESWLKDFSEKTVLQERGNGKIYSSNSKEFKEFFERVEQLNGK